MRLFIIFILVSLLSVSNVYAQEVQPVSLGDPVINTFNKDFTSFNYSFNLVKTTKVGFTLFFHTNGDPADITWNIAFNTANSYFQIFSDSSEELKKTSTINEIAWNSESLDLPPGNYSIKISVPKSLFDENTAHINFLFEIFSNDKAVAANQNDSPSQWAEKEIKLALDSEIVPSALNSNFTSNITRAEFARIAAYYVIKNISGAPEASISAMDTWLDDTNFYRLLGLERKNHVFSDTNDKYVNFVYSVGIVSGTGDGKFSPNDFITREQAAVMLTKAARATKKHINVVSVSDFSDSGLISDWAKESVIYITSVKAYSGDTAVMSGIENGKFGPKNYYTREQAIITIFRLLNSTYSK